MNSNISGGPKNGEEACEGQGFDKAQCLDVGCCQFDDFDRECFSAVGTDTCETGKIITKNTKISDKRNC